MHLGIVWMSAGNSHFKEPVIKELLEFCAARFDKVVVLAPDEPAEHTFRALGYEESEAKKKARLNANLLQNRARRILPTLPPQAQERTSVVEWTQEVQFKQEYRDAYRELLQLYRDDERFATDALATTAAVLKTKPAKEGAEASRGVKEGVFYLLKELAFVLASNQLYGTDEATYVYHKPWPILERLIAGAYDGKRRAELRFLHH